jgi:hypothetical protein
MDRRHPERRARARAPTIAGPVRLRYRYLDIASGDEASLGSSRSVKRRAGRAAVGVAGALEASSEQTPPE